MRPPISPFKWIKTLNHVARGRSAILARAPFCNPLPVLYTNKHAHSCVINYLKNPQSPFDAKSFLDEIILSIEYFADDENKWELKLNTAIDLSTPEVLYFSLNSPDAHTPLGFKKSTVSSPAFAREKNTYSDPILFQEVSDFFDLTLRSIDHPKQIPILSGKGPSLFSLI